MHTHFTHCLFILILLMCFSDMMGQHQCGFDMLHQELLQDTSFQNRQKAISKKIKQQTQSNLSSNKSNEPYIIPVVVHVVYSTFNAPHNISDEQVRSGIQRLNEIFSNADGTSVNANIQFQLANRTPDCQPTNGIVRVNGYELQDYTTEGIDIEANDTDGLGASRIGLLNLSRWNPKEYLNIWVVNEISGNNGGSGIQAFATFPGTHYAYDGVVVLYNAFGYDYDNCNCFQLKPYTDENEIIAHEIGHYLSLYHTFEGDNGGVTCPSTLPAAGDEVADTPAHIRTFSCPGGGNNCYTVSDPFYNMDKIVHNYMGYSTESCQYEFTEGQVNRMRAALEAARPELLTSQGCVPVTISKPVVSCTPQSKDGLKAEYGMGISSVEIGALAAGSGSTFQDKGYLDDWCSNAKFEAEHEYAIYVKTVGYYNEDLRIYIDYNNNGIFENEESVFSSFNKSIHSGTFTTPSDPVFDTPVRLRVISDHNQFVINSGCYEPKYGQVEDYTINFSAPSQAEPIERGLSLVLDGTDDFLQTNFSLDPLTESFTYEFWCKPEGEPSQPQIIFDRLPNNFSTYNFMMLWHGRLFVYMHRSLLFMDAAPLEYNQWHHIAYTWDGQVQRIYINGSLAGSGAVTDVKSNTSKLNFGAFYKNFLFFKGQIDELRTWNEARSAEQILGNMHITNEIIHEQGVSYYHFNNLPENNLIYDYGNHNPAALFGNPGLQTSSVNTGPNGRQQTIGNVMIGQLIDAQDVGLRFIFNEIKDGMKISANLQTFPANTYDGLDSLDVFSNKTWTLNQSITGQFDADISFDFGSGVLTNTNPENYKLYFRSIGNDGKWKLIHNKASHVDESAVTFEGVNKCGQFIVARLFQ